MAVGTIIGAGLGALGSLASMQDKKQTNKNIGNAIEAGQGIVDSGFAQQQGIMNNHDWRSRLNAAAKLRQDANAYEQRQAIQGGLAAYGGSPLTGAAKASVFDRLQQQARQNYQTSLNNANNMLGADLNTRLGISENNLNNQMQLQNTRLNHVASNPHEGTLSKMFNIGSSALQGIANVAKM